MSVLELLALMNQACPLKCDCVITAADDRIILRWIYKVPDGSRGNVLTLTKSDFDLSRRKYFNERFAQITRTIGKTVKQAS